MGPIGVGTGEVPGGGGRFTGCAPGSDDSGGRGTPGGVIPGVLGVIGRGAVPAAGTGSSGGGAISGGGPVKPTFCCVPM